MVYCEDKEGNEARFFVFEPRLVKLSVEQHHRETRTTLPPYVPMLLPAKDTGVDPSAPPFYTTAIVLRGHPLCCRVLQQGGPLELAQSLANEPRLESTEIGTPLHARCETQAWMAQLELQAWAGLEQLFYAMSLSEELWRLGEILKHVPYFMEDTPRLRALLKLYRQQVGHLGLGQDIPGCPVEADEPVRTKDAATWYAEGSPPAGVDVTYVKEAGRSLPTRLDWLIQECRKRGYKRVAELGSIEGVSLFHLIAHAPELEWHGFEVNPEAVAAGHRLVAEVNDPELTKQFHLHHVGYLANVALRFAFHDFDAVALFEVLEHNTWDAGIELLWNAYDCVKPGGHVYLSTPHGNWSAFDRSTRVVPQRKDHINCYSPNRMVALIHCAFTEGEVDEVEAHSVPNPVGQEANAWVFASLRRVY